MENKTCPNCGAPVAENETKCLYCGTVVGTAPKAPTTASSMASAHVDTRPERSKIGAALMAILLGGIGIHKFYLGKTGAGILYILFCWTGVPEILGFIDGIVMLVESDEKFEAKYNCRIS